MQEISTDRRDSLLQEHDYIGLTEVSSVTTKMKTNSTDAERPLEEEDLRLELGLGLGLGLGTGFSKKESEEQAGMGPPAPKNGMKRGFSETMASLARPALKNEEADINILNQHQQHSSFLPMWAPSKPTIPAWSSTAPEKSGATDDAPPFKGQVVGWPPVRTYRKQTLAKPAELFVKVNMDGITVGRKVDLNAYTSYESLLIALEDMFQPSNAQGSSHASSARDYETKHFLLSSGSDFVLTYEDKDGDWMLVGDVPWSMFVSTVRRLRITRGADATGSGTRGLEKSRFPVS